MGSSTSSSIDLEALAAAQGMTLSPVGAPSDSKSRLRMPGQNGPVAASSMPPVLDAMADVYAIAPRRGGGIGSRPGSLIDPAAVAMAGYTGTSISPESETPTPSSGASRIGNTQVPNVPPPSRSESSNGTPTNDDYRRIKSENREIRKLLEEMKQLLQEASDNEQKFATREQELRATLTERQRQTDDLTAQLQLIEEQISSGAIGPAPSVPKTRDELEEWSDELEQESSKIAQERRKIEDERRQLQEDEEALEHQMRHMEVSMARERALIARQETELKRLSAEIQHELEIMQRGDASLRDQLSKFQRRATDVIQGKPPTGGGGGSNNGNQNSGVFPGRK